MRIDDQIRHDTLSSEWEIFLAVEHAHSTLLTMSTSKLITDLRDPLRPHLDLSESLSLLIHSDHHLVYLASLRVLDAC